MVPTRYGSSPMVSSTRPQRGVAHHVQNGREALVDADGPHVAADGGGHMVDQGPGRRWRPQDSGTG